MKNKVTITILIAILLPTEAMAISDRDFMSNGIYFLDRKSSQCLVSGEPGSGTPTNSTREFVRKYIKGAVEVNKKYGVPYEAMMGQAILESGHGGSSLTSVHNNFFGIKADSSWRGASVTMPTTEVYNGKTVIVMADFRSYPTIEAGWTDHGLFINENERYKKALDHPGNPRLYIEEVAKAGYATDPNYASKVTALIGEIETIVKEENLAPPSSQIKLELVVDRNGSVSGSATNNQLDNNCNNNSTGVVAGDIVATAKGLARQELTNSWEPSPAYVEARKKYNPGLGLEPSTLTDCGKFVSTVMRASGADSNYEAAGTGGQRSYVLNNSEKFFTKQNPSFSDLQPGDVLVNNGHTLIFAGDQGGGVWGYHASLGDTTPRQIGKGMIMSQLAESDNVLARVIKK